jgi:hypothetical protein
MYLLAGMPRIKKIRLCKTDMKRLVSHPDYAYHIVNE